MTAVYIIGVIVILIVLVMFFLPSGIHVERSIIVNAPVGKVFEQVNELRNWEKWSPWYKMDPSQKVEYSEPSNGQGAWYTWDSQHKSVDKGKLTLSEVVPNQKIVQVLKFEKWGENSSISLFEETGNGVKVTWKMDNEFKGFAKFIGIMMKGQLRKQFDEGLAGIKAEAEK